LTLLGKNIQYFSERHNGGWKGRGTDKGETSHGRETIGLEKLKPRKNSVVLPLSETRPKDIQTTRNSLLDFGGRDGFGNFLVPQDSVVGPQKTGYHSQRKLRPEPLSERRTSGDVSEKKKEGKFASRGKTGSIMGGRANAGPPPARIYGRTRVEKKEKRGVCWPVSGEKSRVRGVGGERKIVFRSIIF